MSTASNERLDSLSRRNRAFIRLRPTVGFGAILCSSLRSLICEIHDSARKSFLDRCEIVDDPGRIMANRGKHFEPYTSNLFKYNKRVKAKGTQHVFGWVVANRFWISYFDGLHPSSALSTEGIMARLSIAEIFDPSEIVAVHTMARPNRR